MDVALQFGAAAVARDADAAPAVVDRQLEDGQLPHEATPGGAA
jgi:hypothetical protein